MDEPIQPSSKAEGIEDAIFALTGKDRRMSIVISTCMTCDATDVTSGLRDDLSRDEYGISGMCQTCQDSVFGGPE